MSPVYEAPIRRAAQHEVGPADGSQAQVRVLARVGHAWGHHVIERQAAWG